jgi:glycosyltransferase involved in cell wall biosynthesis
MRIALVISSLSAGGAERVMSRMATYWARHGHDVTLVTLDGAETDHFRIDPAVRRVPLGLLSRSASVWESAVTNLRRLHRLRREVKRTKPDVIVSFIEKMNILTLLATIGCRVPVVVSERTDPSRHYIGWLIELLRRGTYRRAAALVVQTETVAGWARTVVGASRIHVIPNPVANASPRMTRPRSDRLVLGVGRLVGVKGFDLLIRAFAACAARHPEWSLRIVGEGPERRYLAHLGNELGLNGRLQLPGRMEVSTVLPQGDLFVLSSQYEGFPNALLEAMAVGLPVISFDCPSGPRHIVRHRIDGLLVPPDDINALTAALDELMSNDKIRRELGRRAREVQVRFAEDSIMTRWDELLSCVARRS